jgi:hypothetical protein
MNKTLQELTAEYNALATQLGKATIKRFSGTRAEALKRIAGLQALLPGQTSTPVFSPSAGPQINIFGFANDHSGSMRSVASAAARDYNNTISGMQTASRTSGQETRVSLVDFGTMNGIETVFADKPVSSIAPATYWNTYGNTPLFDAVGSLIEQFERSPHYANPAASFLIMATTDGEENASRRYDSRRLSEKIRALQATDRWTFVFRVPRGYSNNLIRLGIPAGNIVEWDQTEQGVQVVSKQTAAAFDGYYTARSLGARSTSKFYANLDGVTSKDVEVAMTDISSEVSLWPVSSKDDGKAIRDFVEERLKGQPLLKGAAFYQLVKTEPEVQDHKRIIIRDRTTNAVYEGAAARKMLGLPTYGTIRLAPGTHGNFDLFIQSTSVNRKMNKGTNVVYWPNVGVKYKEGPSSR